jgi:hypothetical protein
MADKTIKKTEPNESALLIAFAHAASKAQEIEGLLQDTVVGARQAGTPGAGVAMSAGGSSWDRFLVWKVFRQKG